MSTKINPPKTIEELRRLSKDEVRYLAQRGRIDNKLIKKYGEDKIRALLDGQEQIAALPDQRSEPPVAPGDTPDTNDLTTWTNKRLRTEILSLSEQLNEEPNLDGKKEELVSRVEELRARVEDEESDEDEEGDDEEGDEDTNGG